jgi:hypothetical protein
LFKIIKLDPKWLLWETTLVFIQKLHI